MAEKLQVLKGREVELKIGQSFLSRNSNAHAFHTLKCECQPFYANLLKIKTFLAKISDDFKPASVDVQKMAKVEVGQTHDITVTVPNIEGSAVDHTVFRGNQKPYQKECVLIIDNNTGEITLERLNTNIQVKKTRYDP